MIPATIVEPPDGYQSDTLDWRIRRIAWTPELRRAAQYAEPEPALVHEVTGGRWRETQRTCRVLVEPRDTLRPGERLAVVLVDGEHEPRFLAACRLTGRAM